MQPGRMEKMGDAAPEDRKRSFGRPLRVGCLCIMCTSGCAGFLFLEHAYAGPLSLLMVEI